MATQRQHDQALKRTRALCTAFPEVSERLSHGSPAWFIREKRTLAMFVDVDWDEVRGILTDSYRKVAPKTIVKLLDA